MTNDEPLAHDDVGEGSPIVFIHGLTFSRRTWAPIVERLSDRFRCVAIDLPGRGESKGSGADLAGVGERLHRTVTSLGIAAPVVVGHSAGALTATAYAANYRAAGVVNVDQPLLVQGFAGFVQQLADALRGPDFAQSFAPFEQSIGVDRLPEPERSRVEGTRRVDQQLVLDHWNTVLTTAPNELQEMVDGLVAAIEVPYLYVGGEELPPELRTCLTDRLSDVEIVAWPGLGHLPHLAASDRFADLVADFAGT